MFLKSLTKICDKYQEINKQAKAVMWYTVCNILQKTSAFLVVPIYIRLLTPSQFGEYTVFMSWKEIIAIFATLNLYCGVFTKAMVDYEHDRNCYISSMQGLTTVIVIVSLSIYLLFKNFFQAVLEFDEITILLLSVYFIVFPALQFWSVRQRVEYNYRILVIVTLFLTIITPIVSLCLLVYTTLNAKALIWGFLIVQIFAGLYFYIRNFLMKFCFFNKKYWLHALEFNIPLIPHYLSLIALSQIDRIMIKEFCGLDKAGIYSLIFSLATVLSFFVGAINDSYVPWMYQKIRDKNYTKIKLVTNKLCILICVLVFGVMIAAPDVLRFIATPPYYEAVWMIPPIATGVYLMFCYNLFSTVEFYFSATKMVMTASVLGALFKIGLDYIFLPMYGYLTAGYITLLCYLFFFLVHFTFMVFVCKSNTQGDLIFDVSYIFRLTLVMLCLMVFCLTVYRYDYIRYLIFVGILIFMYLNRKSIISLFFDVRGHKIVA